MKPGGDPGGRDAKIQSMPAEFPRPVPDIAEHFLMTSQEPLEVERGRAAGRFLQDIFGQDLVDVRELSAIEGFFRKDVLRDEPGNIR